MNKSCTPSVERSATRRLALSATAVVALAGCGIEKPVGTIGFVEGFGGVVAADEPRAVTVARDALSAGGTAADAAVALYFTLAVTQPSTASLGGGGVCVVHSLDSDGKSTVETLDFLSPPAADARNSRVPAAVPGNVRGFFALHAKYGRLRWEQLLSEAERLARFGAPVSRAFAADLAKAAPLLARDPLARAVFFRPDGRVLAEGDPLTQQDLAVSLGRIRRAPGDMYAGAMAREMAESAQRIGASLTAEDLRGFLPQFRSSTTVTLGNDIAHFAPPPAIASGAAAEITRLVAERPDGRDQVLGQASAQAGMAQAVMPGTGFVVTDSMGGAVACGISNQGVFGNGRILPGTGIVLAAAPGINGGPAAVAPMLLVNPHVKEIRFGGTATGGGEAPVTLVSTLFAVTQEGRPLDQAVRRPAPARTPQTVLAPTRINAFHCASGKAGFKTCQVSTDPMGHGMAVQVGR